MSGGITTFEVGVYAIPTTYLLDTFTVTLSVGYHNVTLGFNFFGSKLGTCGALVVSPSEASLEGLLSLLSILFKAHLLYLHWISAFLRWVFSLWRSSGLLHTV